MSPELLICGGVGIVLLIGCLVVREGAEVRLARMRTALMSLRNQERGLENQITALQMTRSQINEAMTRAQGRQSSIAHLLESVYGDLEKCYQHLRGEKLPQSLNPDEEEEGEEGVNDE